MIKLTFIPFVIQRHTVGTLPRALLIIFYLAISSYKLFCNILKRTKLTFMPFVTQHHTVRILSRARVLFYRG
jgi:hypothetical protein